MATYQIQIKLEAKMTQVIKLAIILSIIALLVGAWQWDRSQAYMAGANSVRAEQAKLSAKAAQQSADRLSIALENNQKLKSNAIKIQKQLKESERKFRDEISNTEFRCSGLGTGAFELWNKTIGAEPTYD